MKDLAKTNGTSLHIISLVHISGCVRPNHVSVTWVCFVAELGVWVLSHEGWEMGAGGGRGRQKAKALRMNSL